MKHITKMFTLSLVVAIALLAAACPKRIAIADIQANPSKYSGKEVAIAGTVSDSYGISIPGTNLRGGIYKVSDGTGSIWIVTKESVPQKGARIGVKGKLRDGVNYNGRNYGLGIIEDDRRFADK